MNPILYRHIYTCLEIALCLIKAFFAFVVANLLYRSMVLIDFVRFKSRPEGVWVLSAAVQLTTRTSRT